MENSIPFGKGLNSVVLKDNQIFLGHQYVSNCNEVTKNLSDAIEYSMRMGLKNVTANCLIGKNNGISFDVVVTAIRDGSNRNYSYSHNNNDNYYYDISISINNLDNQDKREKIICNIKNFFIKKNLPIPKVYNNFINLVLDFGVENDFKNIYGCFDTLIDLLVDVLIDVHVDLYLV